MQRSTPSKEKSNITHSSPKTRGGATQGCRGNARVCQEAEARGELGAVAFVGESLGNTRQGRGSILGLETLNNFSGLWGTGEIPSCLVPGPGDDSGRGMLPPGGYGQMEQACSVLVTLHIRHAPSCLHPLPVSKH